MNENRTANGCFATVKEAQRFDTLELIAYYFAEAKSALRVNPELAKSRMQSVRELREAFFADFGEHA